MWTDDTGVQRDSSGLPIGGPYTQGQKAWAGVNSQDNLFTANLKTEAQEQLDRQMAAAGVGMPSFSVNWWLWGGISVVVALLVAIMGIYFQMTTGAREPAERVRLISWAVDGASDEWSLANGWQLVSPGEPTPTDAALLPAVLSQKLLDQAAWDHVGGNPTGEAAKAALRAAAFACLARDYSGCLKAVGESATTTQNNSREFAKKRSKGGLMVPNDLNAPDNFLSAASMYLERKSLNGPTRAQALRLNASMCVRQIPFNATHTLDNCRDYMRAYLRYPETREVAQRKLDAMSGWRWSWMSTRLNAASPAK